MFRRSPEEALERAFAEARHRYPWETDRIWCYQSAMGLHGLYRYGSYKNVEKEYLKTRKYKIEFMDGAISIFWLDVLHDPRTYRNVPVTPETEHLVQSRS